MFFCESFETFPPPPKTSVSISNSDKNGGKSIQNDSEICCFKAPKTGGKIREFVVTILEAWLPLEMTWSLRTRDNFWSQVLIPVRTMEELEGARWWVEWVGFDWWGPAWLNRKECCFLVVKNKIPILEIQRVFFGWAVWSCGRFEADNIRDVTPVIRQFLLIHPQRSY